MTNAILIKIAVPENFSSEEKTKFSKIIEEYFDPELYFTKLVLFTPTGNDYFLEMHLKNLEYEISLYRYIPFFVTDSKHYWEGYEKNIKQVLSNIYLSSDLTEFMNYVAKKHEDVSVVLDAAVRGIVLGKGEALINNVIKDLREHVREHVIVSVSLDIKKEEVTVAVDKPLPKLKGKFLRLRTSSERLSTIYREGYGSPEASLASFIYRETNIALYENK